MNRIFILTPLIGLLIICIFSLVYLLSGSISFFKTSFVIGPINLNIAGMAKVNLNNAGGKEQAAIGTSLFKSALGGLLGSLPLNR